MDNLDRLLAYYQTLPAAISGSGGHAATLRAACDAVRFGLSDAEAWAALTWWNENKCNPRWTEKELRHKWHDAKRLATFGERVKPSAGRVVRPFKVAPVAVRIITSAPAPAQPKPAPLVPIVAWPDMMTFNALADLRAVGGGPRGEWSYPVGASMPTLRTVQ